MKKQEPKRHPLVSLAFILVVFIFIFPAYADMMAAASLTRNLTRAILATLGCYTTVLIPLILGNIFTKQNPSKWSKSKLVRAAWIILTINFIIFTSGFIFEFIRNSVK